MEIFCLLLFIPQLLWICYSDIRWRIISNRMSCLAGGTAILYSLSITQMPNFIAAAIFLGAGFIVFFSGMIGGGDIKLVTALLLALTTAQIYPFFYFTMLASIPVLLIGWLINYSDIRSRGVPLGVAISAGFFITLIYQMESINKQLPFFITAMV